MFCVIGNELLRCRLSRRNVPQLNQRFGHTLLILHHVRRVRPLFHGGSVKTQGFGMMPCDTKLKRHSANRPGDIRMCCVIGNKLIRRRRSRRKVGQQNQRIGHTLLTPHHARRGGPVVHGRLVKPQGIGVMFRATKLIRRSANRSGDVRMGCVIGKKRVRRRLSRCNVPQQKRCLYQPAPGPHRIGIILKDL